MECWTMLHSGLRLRVNVKEVNIHPVELHISLHGTGANLCVILTVWQVVLKRL